MSGGSVLEADRTRLKDVEAEILGLERALDLLRKKKSAIQGRLDAYRYPVLTVPNELVSDIFLQFLPAYPDCPSMSGLFSPTLLTHICRKWREIALTTPSLWRAILSPSDLVPSTQRIQQMESWLERSRLCPVSVIFNNDPYNVEAKNLAADLQPFLPHRLRWEYLKLRTFGNLLPIIEGPTPLLRKLNLRVLGSSSSPVSLTGARLLCTAVLNCFAAASLILPWDQLKSLTLHNVYPRECTPVLLQTLNLVHCQLNLMIDDPDLIEPDVKLPRLESLILVNDLENSRATGYLRTFIVPALRNLKVPEAYIGTDSVTALTSFVAKSGCKLHEVCITGRARSMPDDLYRNALSLVPKMTFQFPLGTRAVDYDSEDEGDEGSEGDEDSEEDQASEGDEDSEEDLFG